MIAPRRTGAGEDDILLEDEVASMKESGVTRIEGLVIVIVEVMIADEGCDGCCFCA